MTRPSFGFLTLAHDQDSLRRSRAMARSLRRQEPEAWIALLAACDAARRIEEFDEQIEISRPEPFSGPYRFFNKLLAMSRHARCERNFFLDDDVLVLRPLTPTILEHFAGRPFAFHCDRLSSATSFPGPNHVDPRAVAAEFGLAEVVDPYGGGHLYFERPGCEPLFREAIELVLHEPELYAVLSGDGFLSDEVALAIVANRNGLTMPVLDGWIDPLDRSRADAIQLDLERGDYRFPGRDRGADSATCLLHFCADGKQSPTYLEVVRRMLDAGGSRQPDRGRTLRGFFGRE